MSLQTWQSVVAACRGWVAAGSTTLEQDEDVLDESGTHTACSCIWTLWTPVTAVAVMYD